MEHIGTQALLFQTGYLTIKAEEELGGRAVYRLGYPNREDASGGAGLVRQTNRQLSHSNISVTSPAFRATSR